MTATEAVLLAQAVASGAMCGLIWFVQVVHYPLFARITGPGSADYARDHQRRTGAVVMPLMLVEGATAAWLALDPPPGVGRPATLVGVALVALVWLSTALVQMPLHGRLARDGHDSPAVARLVAGNWPRTLLWTARACLAAWMLRAGAAAVAG